MFEELTAARRLSFHTSPYLLRKLGSIDKAIWTVSLGTLSRRRMQGRKSYSANGDSFPIPYLSSTERFTLRI